MATTPPVTLRDHLEPARQLLGYVDSLAHGDPSGSWNCYSARLVALTAATAAENALPASDAVAHLLGTHAEVLPLISAALRERAANATSSDAQRAWTYLSACVELDHGGPAIWFQAARLADQRPAGTHGAADLAATATILQAWLATDVEPQVAAAATAAAATSDTHATALRLHDQTQLYHRDAARNVLHQDPHSADLLAALALTKTGGLRTKRLLGEIIHAANQRAITPNAAHRTHIGDQAVGPVGRTTRMISGRPGAGKSVAARMLATELAFDRQQRITTIDHGKITSVTEPGDPIPSAADHDTPTPAAAVAHTWEQIPKLIAADHVLILDGLDELTATPEGTERLRTLVEADTGDIILVADTQPDALDGLFIPTAVATATELLDGTIRHDIR